MAANISEIKAVLDQMDMNYQERDEGKIVLGYTGENDSQIMAVIRLMENGELINIHTVQHLDDFVAQATEENRVKLLEWMLYQNYKTKIGCWEYDPSDHDIHYSIELIIENGDFNEKAFMRGLVTVFKSADVIEEMKGVLGLVSAAEDDKEKKRQELLRQLQELEADSNGI